MTDYFSACQNAAEAQGLTPIIDALTEAGVPNELWQSGGFTMIVTVPTADRTSAWVTWGEEMYGTDPGLAFYTVGHICHRGDDWSYDNCEPCQQDGVVVPIAGLADALRPLL